MGKFINKFCKALNIEVPTNENERASDLIAGLAMCWAMALLGWFAMWCAYGG